MDGDARAAGSQPPLHLEGADLLRLEPLLVDIFTTDTLGSLGFYALGKHLDEFSSTGASRLEVVRDLFQTADDDGRLRELLLATKEFGTRLETHKGNTLAALCDELLASGTPPVPPPPPGQRNVGAIVGGIVLGAIALIAVSLLWPRPGPEPPATPTVALGQAGAAATNGASDTPRTTGLASPASVGANAADTGFPTLSDVMIEDTLLLRDYCAEREQACSDMSNQQLNRMGELITFTVTATNYRCADCTIVWSLHDATTRQRVPDGEWYNRPGWPDGNFTSETHSDQGRGKIWVELPTQPGTYFIRVELRNNNGVPVDFADTDMFTV